jgi:hypothetical protein
MQVALADPGLWDFARDWTGEAVRHYPDDASVLAGRAEALLLGGDPAAALPFSRRAFAAQPDPTGQAVLALSAVLSGEEPPSVPWAEEAVASRALLRVYRRLVEAGAGDMVARIAEHSDRIQQVLPTAARVIQESLAAAALPVPA